MLGIRFRIVYADADAKPEAKACHLLVTSPLEFLPSAKTREVWTA
jgi:hypothetical protein